MASVQPQLLTSARRRLLADGAVRVLAEQGARGLTHRRLDQALGLPEGSTSNAFSTRDALFAAALESLALPSLEAMERVGARLPDELTPAVAAEVFAGTVFGWLTPDQRGSVVARFELILEATRRPHLQATLAELRAAFVGVAERLALAAGAADPLAVAPLLVSLADGVLIAHLSGQPSPPSREHTIGVAHAILMAGAPRP